MRKALTASDLPRGDMFFSRDKNFYKTFFRLFLILTAQNIITYSVNVADNIMLGVYNQTALSGAAAVNQIQYVLQQLTMGGIAEGLVVLASQYWGKRRTEPIQRLTGIALICAFVIGSLLSAAAFLLPEKMVALFTDQPAIQAEALQYLSIVRYSYVIFMVTSILLASLRSVQVVGIAFRLSVMSLFLNIGINYLLIFGAFGFPEMGIRGAAVGTLIARCAELFVLLLYCRKKDLPFRFHLRKLFPPEKSLFRDYLKVTIPCAVSAILFSCSVALQTVIFGHLSEDAIAANSAAGTLFQYCKMIPISASSAAAVWIGRTVGSGDLSRLRSYVRTLQILFVGIGLTASSLLLLISGPILGLYALTPTALSHAHGMILALAITGMGTAYEMPAMCGIIRGGGDTRFVMLSDFVYSWGMAVPLSLLSAFVFKWPVAVIAFCMNADQIVKCLSVGIKTNRYTWIKSLTNKP